MCHLCAGSFRFPVLFLFLPPRGNVLIAPKRQGECTPKLTFCADVTMALPRGLRSKTKPSVHHLCAHEKRDWLELAKPWGSPVQSLSVNPLSVTKGASCSLGSEGAGRHQPARNNTPRNICPGLSFLKVCQSSDIYQDRNRTLGGALRGLTPDQARSPGQFCNQILINQLECTQEECSGYFNFWLIGNRVGCIEHN